MELQFFEVEKDEKLINTWALFPILKKQEFDVTHIEEGDVGKLHIKYLMANTKEFDVKEEQRNLNELNNRRFFRSEFELALCSNNQLYYYVEHFPNGNARQVETLSALGSQTYITEDILLSDYCLEKNLDENNNRLPEFREYINNSYIEVEDFEMVYDVSMRTFTISYRKEDEVFLLFELENTEKDMTLGFVLYVLSNLPTQLKSFKANVLKVKKKIKFR